MVLQTLKKELGYDSWVANSFIRDVQPLTKDNPTLCISREGVIYYNPEFWKKEINTPNKVVEAIVHELLHKVFGDFTRSMDEIENIAGDIIINYTIFKMFGHADLFTTMYKKKMWQGLLRPGSYASVKNTKFRKLYEMVWGSYDGYVDSNYVNYQGGRPSIEHLEENKSIAQVYFALKILMDKQRMGKYILIGSHNNKQNKNKKDSDDENKIKQELDMDINEKGKLAKEILKHVSDKAGYNDTLLNMIVRAIRAECSLKQTLLQDFSISNNINSIKSYYSVSTQIRSVFPRCPSRRDMAMLAAGTPPIFWTNEMKKEEMSKRGIVFYVDVSGSMHEVLPEVIGILSNFKSVMRTVYQFSNDIYKTSLNDLSAGKIKSTDGTDFNCIIDHAIDNKFEKIVIFTDGYADADQNHRNKARDNIKKACVILTGKNNIYKENFFSKTYMRTYRLEELISRK